MKTKLMFVTMTLALVASAAQAEDKKFSSAKQYFGDKDSAERLNQCAEDIEQNCIQQNCIGVNYEEGRCPKTCFLTVRYCNKERREQQANMPPAKNPADAERQRLQLEAIDKLRDIIAALPCDPAAYEKEFTSDASAKVKESCGLDKDYWDAHKIAPRSVWRAVSTHTCCIAIFFARQNALVERVAMLEGRMTTAEDNIADLQTKEGEQDGRLDDHATRIAAQEDCHNAEEGDTDAAAHELKCHPTLAKKADEANKSARTFAIRFEPGGFGLVAGDFGHNGHRSLLLGGGVAAGATFGILEHLRLFVSAGIGGSYAGGDDDGKANTALMYVQGGMTFVFGGQRQFGIDLDTQYARDRFGADTFHQFFGAGTGFRWWIGDLPQHVYVALGIALGAGWEYIPKPTDTQPNRKGLDEDFAISTVLSAGASIW